MIRRYEIAKVAGYAFGSNPPYLLAPYRGRYQADATPCLGRTSTGWIAPASGWLARLLDHLVGTSQHGLGHRQV